jgi:hypothetical protein
MDVNPSILGQFLFSGRNLYEKPARIKRKRPKKAAPRDIA